MNYEVIQISQNQHPEIGVKVTQVSQEVIYDNFQDFLNECERVRGIYDYRFHLGKAYRKLNQYYEQGLTPIQAVKKYFL